jgi:hypothetical protein
LCISRLLTFERIAKSFKAQAHMHHVVISVMIVVNVMLTLLHNVTCYTISPFYHVSMLTLHNLLQSHNKLVLLMPLIIVHRS